MRKVIGIGETILDIIFKNNQPITAVPGGSVFNGLISLGRLGVDTVFISETGNDRVGDAILSFMYENNVSTDYVEVFPNGKSPVSLAFLDEESQAEYMVYKDYPKQRLELVTPDIQENDIVIFGSYYALNPVLREKMVEFLNLAKLRKALIYYDINFRSIHKDGAMWLAPTIIENLEYADIVRGSREDFQNMYNMSDADQIYKDKIRFYCPNFIYTAGADEISLRTSSGYGREYEVEVVEPVSTIGAGDSFNAGIIYGLLMYDVRRENLHKLDGDTWDRIIELGRMFSQEVCQSYENAISEEFACELDIDVS